MKYPYATIYYPNSNGIAHCCINFSECHCITGAMFVIELKKKALGMPIYDVTNTDTVFSLDNENIIKRGGVIVKL